MRVQLMCAAKPNAPVFAVQTPRATLAQEHWRAPGRVRLREPIWGQSQEERVERMRRLRERKRAAIWNSVSEDG